MRKELTKEEYEDEEVRLFNEIEDLRIKRRSTEEEEEELKTLKEQYFCNHILGITEHSFVRLKHNAEPAKWYSFCPLCGFNYENDIKDLEYSWTCINLGGSR